MHNPFFLRPRDPKMSIISPDYDDKACRSKFFPQRFWHYFKDRLIFNSIDMDKFSLDLGCGSGVVVQRLNKAAGVDIDFDKLYYLKKNKKIKGYLVLADIRYLPFKKNTFEQIVCSEVIEHIERDGKWLEEIVRISNSGSNVVLTTPDYGNIYWPVIEWLYKIFLPNGYADQHISHYTMKDMVDILTKFKFRIIKKHSLFKSVVFINAVLESQRKI